MGDAAIRARAREDSLELPGSVLPRRGGDRSDDGGDGETTALPALTLTVPCAERLLLQRISCPGRRRPHFTDEGTVSLWSLWIHRRSHKSDAAELGHEAPESVSFS